MASTSTPAADRATTAADPSAAGPAPTAGLPATPVDVTGWEVADTVPAVAPAPPPARPRVLLVGTALALAGTFMAFAGLIGVYLATRAATLDRTGAWLPEETVIPLTPANMILVTFAMSVVTMHWAVWSVGKNDRPHAYLALGITILFGVCVINATTFLYSQMNLGIRDSAAAVLIYVITTAHLAMVVAALVFAGLMTFRTLGGQYAGRDKEGISAAAMCWYATVAVYVVIWLAIYVTK